MEEIRTSGNYRQTELQQVPILFFTDLIWSTIQQLQISCVIILSVAENQLRHLASQYEVMNIMLLLKKKKYQFNVN